MNYINTKLILIGGAAGLGYFMYKYYTQYKTFLKLLRVGAVKVESATVHNKHIEIPYTYMNTAYSVRLPYDPTKVAAQTQWLVKAVDIHGVETDITQQPGVPYLVNSEDLDVDKIIVCDLLEEVEKPYLKAKPYYGDL